MTLTEPKVDEHWNAGPYGLCRTMLTQRPRRYCRQPTVASVLRGRTGQRWGYCATHLADFARVVRGSDVWWDPKATGHDW